MNQLKKLYMMSEQNSQKRSASSLASSTTTDGDNDDDRLRRLLAVCEEMSTTSDVSETAQPQKTTTSSTSDVLTFEKLDDDADDDVREMTATADNDLSQIKADVSKCIQESIMAIENDQSMIDNEKNEPSNAIKIDSPTSPPPTLLAETPTAINEDGDDYESPKLTIDFKNDDDVDDSMSENLSLKSTTSSTAASSSSKKRGARRSIMLDEDKLAALRIPMEVFGWIREVAYRGDGVSSDVYYRAPNGNRKLRSMVEVGRFLAQTKSDELTLEHFSFAKQPLHCHNEFVRQSHGRNVQTSGDSSSVADTPFKTPKEEKVSNKKSKIKVVEKSVKITSTPKLPPPTPKEKSPAPSTSTTLNGKEMLKTSQKPSKEKTSTAAAVPALFSEPLLIIKTSKNSNGSSDFTAKDGKKVEETSGHSTLKIKIKQRSSTKRKFEADEAPNADDAKTSMANRRRRSSSPSSSSITDNVEKSSEKTSTAAEAKTSTATPKILPKNKKFKSAHVLSLERDFKLIKKKNYDVGVKKLESSDGRTGAVEDYRSGADTSSSTEAQNVNGLGGKKIVLDMNEDDDGSLVSAAERSASNATPAIEISESPPPPTAAATETTTTLCRSENRACDNRATRDAICANCLLEFHVDCAAKLNGGGKIVASNGTTSKNAYFLCFSCYEELDTTYRQKSDNRSEFFVDRSLIEAVTMAAAAKTTTTLRSASQMRNYFFLDANVHYDLLKRIFSHLSVQDLLRVRQVCRMWNDVAILKEFWELAPLKGCQIKDWTRTSEFLRDRKVETLDFFGVRTSVNAFVKSLEEMDYLKGLKFGHIVPLVLDVIKNCQKTLSKLESLRFTVTEQKKSENLSQIVVSFELLRHTASNLRQLRMSGGRFFELKPDSTEHLSKLINLTHLFILDMNLGADESKWAFLKCLTNLKVLKIGSCVYWSSKIYEIISQLKNLESLCLEWGETLPNDFLSHSLAVLPKLRHLHLVKFSISATLMSLIASKRQLETLTVWPRFHDSNAKQSWRNLVDGLAKQKFIQIFTLGIGSENLIVFNDQSADNIITQKGESLRFAAEDETNAGHIKSIHIDAFTRYAQNFVRYVINKYTKDESLFATRCN